MTHAYVWCVREELDDRLQYPLMHRDVGVRVLRFPTQTHLNCYSDVL